jgi:hypothetical protein
MSVRLTNGEAYRVGLGSQAGAMSVSCLGKVKSLFYVFRGVGLAQINGRRGRLIPLDRVSGGKVKSLFYVLGGDVRFGLVGKFGLFSRPGGLSYAKPSRSLYA